MIIGKYNITKEVEFKESVEYDIDENGDTDYMRSYDTLGDSCETGWSWWRIELEDGGYIKSILESEMDFKEIKAKAEAGEF